MEWQNDTELFELMRTKLYTAIVGDILDTIGRWHQFLPPQCQPLRPDMVVAGRAMTVLGADIYEETDPPFGLMLEALDSLKPNEVYVCAGSSNPYALWGELMSTAARARGATGAVIAGFIRDTNGILTMNFPVFCHGRYAQDTRVRGKVIAHHVDLEIGGARVRPGDIVFGDIDGVLVVPRQLEAEVISEALERSRQERSAKGELAKGRMATEVFKEYGIF